MKGQNAPTNIILTGLENVYVELYKGFFIITKNTEEAIKEAREIADAKRQKEMDEHNRDLEMEIAVSFRPDPMI